MKPSVAAAANILVVDDEESIRGILTETLAGEGYRVTTAASAEEALKTLSGRSFDVVVSDIRMPGLSGIQLLQRIKGQQLDLEVVIMTSNASLDTSLEAIRLGAYDYLLKPFEELDYVATVIRRAVERRRMARENRELLAGMQQKNAELERATQRAAQILAEGRASCGQLERLVLSRDLEGAGQSMADGIARQYRSRCVSVWFRTGTDPELRVVGRVGVDADKTPFVTIAVAAGVAGEEAVKHWISGEGKTEFVDRLGRLWNQPVLELCPINASGETVGFAVWAKDASVAGGPANDQAELFFLAAGVVLQRHARRNGESRAAPAVAPVPGGTLRLQDNITPLMSFDFFQELLEIEIRRSRRYRHRFTVVVVMLGLTGEAVDDPAVTQILQEIATQIRARVRSTDFTTRYGQRFFMLLPETTVEDARVVEQSLTQLLAAYREEYSKDPLRSRLCGSLAMAEYPRDGDAAASLIANLETALAQGTPRRG